MSSAMSMSKPSLQIIIPTYNRVRYLEPCIRSVLAQSFTDFELVVLDNASEDDVATVVARFDDKGYA